MSNVSIPGMPGYPGASGTINAVDSTAYFHGVQTQGGTIVDVAFNINTVISQAMLIWFTSLPTSKPGTSGVLWNNGGLLALS